jgi:hypothetical protein
MALDYPTLQTACLVATSQAASPYTVVPPAFAAIFPLAISYAENRIYSDLMLLATRQSNTTLATTAGSRTINMTALPLVVAEGFGLCSPTGSTTATGTFYPYEECSLDMIDILWPEQSVTLAPSAADNLGRWWALLDADTIVVAPTPDAAYTAVITGLFQPEELSASNPTTYLTAEYPELMTTATMIYLSGWVKKNYGAQSEDPKMAVSYESQYAALKDGALLEEMRRRGMTPNLPRQPLPQTA